MFVQLIDTLKYGLNKNIFKMFVTVNKHQYFRSFIKRHLSSLNTCPATLKNRLLVILKLLTIFSNLATMFLADGL